MKYLQCTDLENTRDTMCTHYPDLTNVNILPDMLQIFLPLKPLMLQL